MIRVKDLSITYPNGGNTEPLSVLQSINLEVPLGKFVSLVGPSGCGKTTFLKCMSGVLAPTTGSIRIGDATAEDVRQHHNIGFVFQKALFFEWKTILQNVLLPAEIARRSDGLDIANVYLKQFGLGDFSNAYPHELSGGMLARAALARALVNKPEILLLDEAFNNLDEILRIRINSDIENTFMSKGFSCFAVTHDIVEAILLSDFIVIFSRRPSTIVNLIEIPLPRPRVSRLINDRHVMDLADKVRLSLASTYDV